MASVEQSIRGSCFQLNSFLETDEICRLYVRCFCENIYFSVRAFGKQMRWIILYSFGSRMIAIVISQSLWICFSFVIHRHSSPPLIVIPFYAQSKNLSSKYYNCWTVLVHGKHTGSDGASNVTKDVSIYAMWLKKQGVGKLDVHVFGDYCSGTPTTSISPIEMRKKNEQCKRVL